MAETPDETRREIEETRERITEAAEQLEERFERVTDWRHTIDAYPLEIALGALTVGFVLGSGVLFRAVGRLFGGGGNRNNQQTHQRSGSSVASWIQPIVMPVITSLVVRYIRESQQSPRQPQNPKQ
ncbi:MAG TPA: hypothetical protein VGK02_00745 [Candidatus Aquicultor sp.]|jgi:hypothetical protein